jgi:uncharacterized protein DUF5678
MLPNLIIDKSVIEKYDDNFLWFVLNYEKIKDKYKNKYVTIDNNSIVDDDYNLDKLHVRLKQKYSDKINYILVKFIPDKNYAMD